MRARMNLPFVRVLSTIERHNAFQDDPIQFRGGWAMDRDELWAMAGIRPDDVDFLQTYDDYPVIVMMQIEDLGFCAKGEAPEFVRAHTPDNRRRLSRTTPRAASCRSGRRARRGGYLGLVEAIRQLTDEAGGTTVPDAAIGLVSGFGMINYDRGLASSAVLLARA